MKMNEYLENDKKKICEWIMSLDIDNYYELCCVLVDNLNMVDKKLFYSCCECKKEHGDVCEHDPDFCKKMFIKHYMKNI